MRQLSLSLTCYNTQESGLIPHLGSTTESTLLAGVCGLTNMHERFGPSPQLPYGGVGKGEMSPTLFASLLTVVCSRKCRWTGSEGVRAGKLTTPYLLCGGKSEREMPPPSLPPATGGRTGPAPWLGQTVELALVVWVQVNLLWGYESRKTGPTPCCLMQWVS